jgi:hypothetical protein
MSPTLPREEGVENASQTAVQEPRMIPMPETAEKRATVAEMLKNQNIKSKLPPGSFTYLSPEYRKQQARGGLDSYTEQLDKIMLEQPDTTEAGIAEAIKNDLIEHFEGKTKGLDTIQRKTEKAEKDKESVRQELLSGKLAPSKFVGMEIKKPEVAAVIKKTLEDITPSREGKSDAEIAEDEELMETSKKNISALLDLDPEETDYSAVDRAAERALASNKAATAPTTQAAPTQVGAALQDALTGKDFTPAPSTPQRAPAPQGDKSSVMRPQAAKTDKKQPENPQSAETVQENVSLEIQEERKKNILRQGLTDEGFLAHPARIPVPTKEDLPRRDLAVGRKIKLQDSTTFEIGTWEIKNLENGIATIFNLDNSKEERTIPAEQLREILKTNDYYKGQLRAARETPAPEQPANQTTAEAPQAAEPPSEEKVAPETVGAPAGAGPQELANNGFLPQAAQIPEPKMEDLPSLPNMEVGQKIRLQDSATLEIAVWEIKSIDKGVVTIFNTEKEEDERTISTGELKEIVKTNKYYTNKLEQGRFEVLPFKQLIASFSEKTDPPYNLKSLASWRRNWIDSGKIDEYRARYGNIPVSDEMVRSYKRTIAVCLDALSHEKANREIKEQAVTNIYIAGRILAGYNDNDKNNIQYYVENNILNDGWLDSIEDRLDKLDETEPVPATVEVPATPIQPQAVVQPEPEKPVVVPTHIQDMMNQVYRQAQADQFMKEEKGGQQPPSSPSQAVDQGLAWEEVVPASPAQAPAQQQESKGWKEKALGRIKNIMTSWEGRRRPTWREYATVIAITGLALVEGGEAYKIFNNKEKLAGSEDAIPTQSSTTGMTKPTAAPSSMELPWTARIIESDKSGGVKDMAMMIGVEDTKLSPEDLMKKYVPSYFANKVDPAQTRIALGMFGDRVQNDNMNNLYNLSDQTRMELSNFRAALELVSLAASGEPLKTNTTFEQEIMEIKQKVAQKES